MVSSKVTTTQLFDWYALGGHDYVLYISRGERATRFTPVLCCNLHHLDFSRNRRYHRVASLLSLTRCHIYYWRHAVPLIREMWMLRPPLRLLGFVPKMWMLGLLLHLLGVPLIPELCMLWPLLRLLLGPIKDSIAACIQRVIFDAAVPAGSWFSWLQAARMRMPLKWAWFIILLLILGVFTWAFGYFWGAAVPAGSWFYWFQMGMPRLNWAWFIWKSILLFTCAFGYFWGAVVPLAGSWFSWFQAAGMGMSPLNWAWLIWKFLLLILGVFVWFFGGYIGRIFLVAFLVISLFLLFSDK
ncbi:hypothetical protein L210DRAFT_3534539 [Boletus edulis BED1]|uniref:Uncharacterized protein n=1 Tax=Boletus edulis BED1 TaxID=1328754 RepID=A0AAD4GGT5_BOLED|nr:hypothetical protein L210DRAFT_3534539 [Boletus edulis BED1]